VSKPPGTYEEVLAWLYQQLPYFQRQGAQAFRPGLDKISQLMDHLGQPHKAYPTLHIGGTNGKGSTSHMLSAVLQQAGYRVGLYTSPHLKDFRERIKINGRMMAKSQLMEFVHRHFTFFQSLRPTFFEWSVALAFNLFKQEKVDIAIVEVGMGGRLDATNILEPVLSVITNISLDHTQYLGADRASIAGEKAGIIKPNIPVIIGEKDPITAPVFERKARDVNAPLHYAQDTLLPKGLKTDLKGVYQAQNLLTAYTALQLLQGFRISAGALEKGFAQVAAISGFQGRWQTLGEWPKIIADVSHNEAGFSFLKAQLAQEDYVQLHLVIGFVKDKEVTKIIPYLPKDARYYLTQSEGPRALEVETLSTLFTQNGFSCTTYKKVAVALQVAKKQADSQDLILVTGSTFVVAEVL
jgi:dihydrofolate synthase/folylpolyglutamate synthase